MRAYCLRSEVGAGRANLVDRLSGLDRAALWRRCRAVSSASYFASLISPRTKRRPSSMARRSPSVSIRSPELLARENADIASSFAPEGRVRRRAKQRTKLGRSRKSDPRLTRPATFGKIGLPDAIYPVLPPVHGPALRWRGFWFCDRARVLRHGDPPDDWGEAAGGIDRFDTGVRRSAGHSSEQPSGAMSPAARRGPSSPTRAWNSVATSVSILRRNAGAFLRCSARICAERASAGALSN